MLRYQINNEKQCCSRVIYTHKQINYSTMQHYQVINLKRIFAVLLKYFFDYVIYLVSTK